VQLAAFAALPCLRRLDVCGCTKATADALWRFVAEKAVEGKARAEGKQGKHGELEMTERTLEFLDCRFITMAKAMRRNIHEHYPRLELLCSAAL
jgi:hypothetical protein